MHALLKVEWLKLTRSLGIFLLSIGMTVIFFLIFSSTVDTGSAEGNKQFIQSYMLTMTSFSMSAFALFTFPMMLLEDRNNNWLAFVSHSSLSIGQYYMSKYFRVALCFMSSIVIVFAVGAIVKQVNLSLSTWIMSALLLLLTSTVYLVIGLILAQLKSEQTMSVVGNFIYFALAILGGSWMPIRLFPEWVQTICRLTPSYHVNHLVVTFAQEGTLVWKSLLIVFTYGIIFTGIVVLIHKKFKEK